MKGKRTQSGMGLLEVTIAVTFLAGGLLVIAQMLGTSAEASTRQTAKTQAVETADQVVQRVADELAQSADAGSSAASARVTVTDAGRTVLFRRVVGTRIVGGGVETDWSVPVRIFWTPADGTIRRQVGDREPSLVARGVTDFVAAQHPNGSIAVEVELVRKKDRMPGQAHRAQIRVKPRN